MINDYVALDLETTGLDPKKDKITEIGAARIRDGKEVATLKTFVNPGRLLDDRIKELTGITDDDLKNAPYIEDIIKDVVEFIGDDILLGHSILFDYSFLKRAAVNNNIAFEKEGIDTLKISRIFLAELPSRALGNLCVHYDIPHVGHRALNDALATSQLYQKLLQDFYKDDSKAFKPDRLIYKVKKEGPITKAQFERLNTIISTYQLDINQDISRLTKNEASRLLDNIIASGLIHNK